MTEYIHTYTSTERDRLWRQSRQLAPIIFDHIDLSSSRHILDFGCGIGAQSALVAERYPDVRITGIDREATQIQEATIRLQTHIESNRVTLIHSDNIEGIETDTVDTVLLTWVLEHVANPVLLIKTLRQKLKPGTRIICTEVFNSSMYSSSDNEALKTYWAAFNRLQKKAGCDVDIGVRLRCHFSVAGFSQIAVRPLTPLIDKSMDEPDRLEAIRYWRDLLLSASNTLEAKHYITPETTAGLKAYFDNLRADDDEIFMFLAFQCDAIV